MANFGARFDAKSAAPFHSSVSHSENPKLNTGVLIAITPCIVGSNNHSVPFTNAIMTTAQLI